MKGTASGAASGVASGAMKYMKNPNGYCFVAGTIVATVLGFAAIETIQAGDYVLAKDVDTGIVSYEPVLQTFVREVDETYTITINGEEIETTAEHPFYVENEGFVQAQDLEAGDNVETADGDTAEVDSVQKNELDEPVLVYNFEVMDDHTYYVGETGVLVHNKCRVAKNSASGERIIPGEEGIVTGGDSTKLGKNMMESMGQKRTTKWTGYQAQHVIPAEMKNNPVLQKIGMNLDDASNGLFLRSPGADVSAMSRHRGYHSVYSKFVEMQLNAMDLSQSSSVLQSQVLSLQNDLKLLQMSGLPLYEGQGATLDLWSRSFNRLH